MAKALIAQSKFEESLKWLKKAIALISDKNRKNSKGNKKLSFWQVSMNFLPNGPINKNISISRKCEIGSALAHVEMRMGHFEEADQELTKIYRIIAKKYGKNSEKLAEILEERSDCQEKLGNIDEAIDLLVQVCFNYQFKIKMKKWLFIFYF